MNTTRLTLALMCFSACEAPLVIPTADKRQNSSSSRIEGNVVVTSSARGKVVLFLYDAARPPPPAGTGRPLTFTIVSREAVFGSAPDGSSGPFTAPFAFSLVAPGQYLIRGLIDANDDFIPWYGVTADATAGDVGGAAVDPVTRQPRVIEVGVTAEGVPLPALDVPVSFTDAARVPLDRPIFSIVGGATSALLASPATVLELQATPVVEGVLGQSSPGFLLRFVDDNQDGMPDDANGDGQPDLWPRVIVRKLAGASALVDDNDLDRNGVADAEGTDYEHADGSLDGKPDVVVLAAGFDPTEYAAQLVDGMGRVKQTPTAVPKLKLVLRPRAFDASTPAAPQPLKSVPVGRYAIIVIQQTGQTWRVPNELSEELAPALGLPVVSSQGFVLSAQ